MWTITLALGEVGSRAAWVTACQAKNGKHNPTDTCLFTFEFTGEGLRSCYDALGALSNARPKRQVERPGFSSTVEPCHDFIPAEQAKLLLELELKRQKSAIVRRR